MPQVQSRVNGIIINIPPDAAGIVGRFQTKGGNELVFEQTGRGGNQPAAGKQRGRSRSKGGDDTLHIGGKRQPNDLA